MPKVLVTGSSGFLGTAVSALLTARGYEVLPFDLVSGPDVTVESDLRPALEAADAVVHLAAPCSALMFRETPVESWDTTIRGMANVLQYARGRVVLASTCTLYGDSPLPVTEDHLLPAAPNLYAAGKLECERLCFLSALTRGTDVKICRVFSGYGPGERFKGPYASPVMHFLRDLHHGRRPRIFGDGSQIRDFVYIDDVAAHLVAALETKSKEYLFNVGTGLGTSFLEMTNLIGAALGREANPELVPAPPGYVANVVSDPSRSIRELGLKAQVGFAEGIVRMVEEVKPEL
jgi:UDP-glucose 4-epimerase